MAKEILVGKTSDFNEGDKKIIPNGKSEIGVYLVNGNWYAYQNLCPHQGGPACEGLLMAKVEEVIDPVEKTYHGMRFNHDEMHIVCPWHGWEFDISNGEACGDRTWKLRKYEVDVRGEEVYVLT